MKIHPLIPAVIIVLILTACAPDFGNSFPGETTTPTRTRLPVDTDLPTVTFPPGASPSPTQPAKDPVYVTAFCSVIGKDPVTYVDTGTPVVITWGWNAKTEAQVNDFLENNITTITLDGQAIEGVMTGGIQQYKGMYEVVWQADVGVLSNGQHAVTYAVKWKKMIDDGTNTYGPGGQIETTRDACQIVVK